MTRAAIVGPVRTPIGAFGGALRGLSAVELATAVVTALVERTGVDSAAIEDVVFAQSYANSEAPCIGRWAALNAGLPVELPGMQLDRRCGGGLQAVLTAAMMVQSGAADVVIAGGVESMSNIEHYSTDVRWGARTGPVTLHDRLDRGRERSQPAWRFGPISGMVETAETLATEQNISRADADAFAVRSHRRAAAARDRGDFAAELVAVEVPQRKGDPVTIDADEGIRPDTSTEILARLRPVRSGGTVTAGNSSQQNDAAAACLVVAEHRLAGLGLTPMAYLIDWAAVGCDPARMGLGPVGAVRKLFARTGLGFDELTRVELNEAFAAQALAVFEQWGWYDDDKVNVNGSGISLGHPIGATGVRILTTMVHDLQRLGGGLGLETMCIGGGQGLAAVFESA
jgi:acetyl-CoA C-acetyltransferase